MVREAVSGHHTARPPAQAERYRSTTAAISVTCAAAGGHGRSPEAPLLDVALKVVGVDAEEAAVADHGEIAGCDPPAQRLDRAV